ncbi:hypothetical protein, partial [Aeromonas hydrophila]
HAETALGTGRMTSTFECSKKWGDYRALRFGNQKINLQLLGQEPRNRAQVGAGDLCLITRWPLEQVIAQLHCHGVEIVEGPVTKSGACGPIESVYCLDPDQNLIEISRYP